MPNEICTTLTKKQSFSKNKNKGFPKLIILSINLASDYKITLFSIAWKLINICWIRTGPQPYWIMYCIVLHTIFHKYEIKIIKLISVLLAWALAFLNNKTCFNLLIFHIMYHVIITILGIFFVYLAGLHVRPMLFFKIRIVD